MHALHKGMYMLSTFETELRLLIAGNHETSLDRDFCVREGGSLDQHETARSLMIGDMASSYGVTLLDEGTHAFRLRSGARFSIYVSPYTPEYGISAFQYPSMEDRFNPSTKFDWAVSTVTPRSIIPEGVISS